MTETMTASFVISPEDKAVIKAKAQQMSKILKSDVSDSAALRAIVREWAEQQPTSPTATDTQQ